eukprot:TRINITY_DN1372_c0_g1_i1.p1 TRINITY_DN1372_c0_g1~~TRINITY_DN1372_c0_g1_i1.p1  ORF type:complete len:414 (-),score=163.76 TRINITY_DN1372_c0_g1_i1:38-1246(-)
MKRNCSIVVLLFIFLFSLSSAEFIFKRLNKNNKGRDIISLKFEDIDCRELLSRGGIASKIKGSFSSHCLPINDKGDDFDMIKFYGTCINLPHKNSYLRIFEMRSKRDDNLIRPHTEIYLRLKSKERDVKFQIKDYGLRTNQGRVYIEKRPTCTSAIDFCKEGQNGEKVYRVISCNRNNFEQKGKLKKNDKVYIEITKRQRRANVCKGNDGCCSYISSNKGLCKLKEARKEYFEEKLDLDDSYQISDVDGIDGFSEFDYSEHEQQHNGPSSNEHKKEESKEETKDSKEELKDSKEEESKESKEESKEEESKEEQKEEINKADDVQKESKEESKESKEVESKEESKESLNPAQSKSEEVAQQESTSQVKLTEQEKSAVEQQSPKQEDSNSPQEIEEGEEEKKKK